MAGDPEYEAAPGAEATPAAPGDGAHEQEAPSAAPPASATPSEPAPPAPRPTNAGRLWVTVGVATILLVLLIIFIAENSRDVTISFLGAGGKISLALALLIAAVVGAAVTLLAGTARILQLRREVRRHRRARMRERLEPR